jgi:two-component system sensor histidine kinase FlrB
VGNPQLLADAFSEFIAASAQLEASYRGLQLEVSCLSGELAERNTELTRSLAENDRIRTALQKIIDSLPCGVLVLGRNDAIITINPEAMRLLGIEPLRVDKLSELSLASGIDFAALAASQSEQLDTELCLTRQGATCWLAIRRRELACSLERHELAPASLRSIWILRDVTATRLADQEREAARRATALAEISSILAHEIRNPLASLELFAELIAKDPDARSQWIAHLRAGIRTLSGTVNNVLSMNGENSLRIATIDLARCVEEAVEFVRPVADQAGVSLRFVAAEATLAIQGNEDGIRQIILNLACNAIRHTPSEGRVDVLVKRQGRKAVKSIVVEVRDSGCGIPEEQLERLFEAGFSGTGETPGLGLAVCRRLMQQHRGTIRVSSRPNHGSTFSLEFPES